MLVISLVYQNALSLSKSNVDMDGLFHTVLLQEDRVCGLVASRWWREPSDDDDMVMCLDDDIMATWPRQILGPI